jgi:thymidylate kinase
VTNVVLRTSQVNQERSIWLAEAVRRVPASHVKTVVHGGSMQSVDEQQDALFERAFGRNETPRTPRHQYIQIEGPDSIGKTTQAEMLGKALGIPVLKPSDKQDLDIQWAYKLALQNQGMTRYLLFAWMRSRALQYAKDMDTFILDRGPISPLVYQGFMDNVDIEAIMKIEKEILKDFRSLRTILLSAEKPFSRDANDEYDKLVYSKWKEWRHAYIKASLMWDSECMLIFCDGKTKEEIHQEIMENLGV